VAAQSSFRRAFHFRTSAGRRFVVVGHLCHGCRGRFPNETAAARFLADELPPEIAQADGRT
jgi:hypothetical protein